MKKNIFLILIFLSFPMVVFATGGSDNKVDELGTSHMNINCVYEQQEVVPMTHGELKGNGTYINLEFVGIGNTPACGGGTLFTYSFGKYDDNGKFEKNYEYQLTKRWLNFNKAYGSEYWLQAWWCNQFFKDDSMEFLSGSKIQSKADNGDFCPKQVLVTQKKENSAYYFVSCRDDADCIASKNKLSKDGIYKNTNTFKFTGTSMAISNINQEKQDETNAADKVEEAQKEVEVSCDETAANYDASKCEQSKIISNSTQNTASDIITFVPNIELEKVDYGKVTCATIFGTGSYNETHRLLSTCIKFIQYLAIVLALVLSIIDYIKVIPTNDKDALMKTTKNSAIRLGIAIAIFLVPVLLKFVLEILGITNAFCGLV